MPTIIFTRKFIFFSPIWLAALLMAIPAFGDLVPRGAQWKYLDDGSDQQNLWLQRGFDDSSWPSGAAQLGYGDGDEATVVSFGPDASNKHTTTYFRHQFTLPTLPTDPLTLRVQRDDGVVVYLNGTEVFRDNMPDGTISASTFALSTVSSSDESAFQTTTISPASLEVGSNTLAVEIHQRDRNSTDISFDLQLTDNKVVRGPYLQQASSSGITVRWRTLTSRDALVRYGTDPLTLNQVASDATTRTDHAVTLNNLMPATRYYYIIGDTSGDFAASSNQFFDTHPEIGTATPTRIWVLGDSGTANANAAAVRDAYLGYNGGAHNDVWLMLGDNAYNDGTDSQYQDAVFEMYPQVLRNSVLWPTLGNHDGHTAFSANQSGPYYDIFTLPTNGESGGVGSGTEAYYSFDYGNIHFVCLDSHDSDRSTDGAMATWLQNDLAANTQEWIIAFWHHPPYSKGSHDSDTEGKLVDMRENLLPILETYGVDLVLGGHSHSYERSMLINGHYGSSGTFGDTHTLDGGDGDPFGDGAYNKSASSNNGSVYTVAGSSGKISSATLNHPVMISNWVELGSMVIDVNGNQLDAIFLNSSSTIRDSFRIVHQSAPTTPPVAPSGLTATASSATEAQLSWIDNANDENNTMVRRWTDQSTWDTVATLGANAISFNDSGLSPDTTYYYSVIAANAAGNSPPSNTASVTTPMQPEFVDYFAIASTAVTGNVSGSLGDIQADDGSVQSITELESGGKPSKRRSLLEHHWEFSLQPGSIATLHANAYSSGSVDNDRFAFSYSEDGGSTWQSIFTVNSTDLQHQASGLLAAGVEGSVLIRVIDTDRTQGHRALDTVYVDKLYIRIRTVAGTPPTAPSRLTASAITATSVSLGWQDNSTEELGFEIERKVSGNDDWSMIDSVGVDVTTATDQSAASETTYHYRVRAYNGSGMSVYSDEASATTPELAISLTASGHKTKGVIHANLSWPDGSGTVDVYRNSSYITSVSNGNSYSDNTGKKGSATFIYQICKAGSNSECSNEVTVAF